MFRIIVIVVAVFITGNDVVSAQLLQRRCLQVRSRGLQESGLPQYVYRTANPARSVVGFGYGIKRASKLGLGGVEEREFTADMVEGQTLAFRFPIEMSLPTGNGSIHLTELGAQIDSKGNLIFAAKLNHDGGRDTLLKSPYVCLEVDVQTSLSNKVTPAPDAVSIQTYKQSCRAANLNHTTIRIMPTCDSDRSVLRQNFESITHLRIQMTYYPDK